MKLMRNILYTMLLAVFALVACTKKEERVVIPQNISQPVVTLFEGAVEMRWDMPALPTDYLYVQLTYTHPKTGKHFEKKISSYADSVLVDDMLAKDGEYTFTFQTFSETGHAHPDVYTIAATALQVQPKVTNKVEKISLTAGNLSTNAQEPSEGPIADLVDGKLDTFFHSTWSKDIPPAPHYIDIRLPEPVDEFEFTTYYRRKAYGSNTPKEVTILGSNDSETWETITSYTDLGGSGVEKYNSPRIKTDKLYRNLRYQCDQTSGGANPYFELAELEIRKCWTEVYDPEGLLPK